MTSTCSICLNDFSGMITQVDHLTYASLEKMPKDLTPLKLKCTHIFHTQCIQAWVAKCKNDLVEPTCPLCRTDIIEDRIPWKNAKRLLNGISACLEMAGIREIFRIALPELIISIGAAYAER